MSADGRNLITVRYFAAARAAAGVTEETVPPAGSLTELIDTLADRHGGRMAKVLAVSSYLVDGVVRHDRYASVGGGSTVDVLPPFAGG